MPIPHSRSEGGRSLPDAASPTAGPDVSDVCVIIPMFNESIVIADVVRELRAHVPLVVCVDDGSTDSTVAAATAAGALVLRHSANLGQGAALQTGFQFAAQHTKATYFVTYDADGQHRPEDAMKLLRTARSSGVDVVLGSRFLETNPTMPLIRRLLLRGATRFTRTVTGLPLSDAHNGLRVFTRNALMQISIELNGMAHASELLHQVARLNFRYVEAPVTIAYTEYSRSKGQSAFNALNILYDLAVHTLRAAP